ncbi:MAG: cytochrome ubiquinol oxidase subunit II [Patescibacteria group bacterium]|nr:cytochrome ubiquinol oxidase subunit II [Patescibacteria group bacterium]
MPVLFPHGVVASQESALIVQATLLMLIVALPVFFLLFYFAWRYRASGRGRHMPNWSHSRFDELIWWAVPIEIILVLGALTWTSTHMLDPHKPLSPAGDAMVVQVVALPWKWLFLYPQYGIATLNFVEIPTQTPVEFQITADAPMNSFWVPALGGQIYAMPGMINPLRLSADSPGDYHGVSANYSGAGFADMHFNLRAASRDDFDTWVASVRKGKGVLSAPVYSALRVPGVAATVAYARVQRGLFDRIVGQFLDAGSPMRH